MRGPTLPHARRRLGPGEVAWSRGTRRPGRLPSRLPGPPPPPYMFPESIEAADFSQLQLSDSSVNN